MIKKIKNMLIFKNHEYNHNSNAVLLEDGTVYLCISNAKDRIPEYGRYSHVDPTSKIIYVVSKDNGNTWSDAPGEIYDDFSDAVNDPCLNMLKDGKILCSFFKWKVYHLDDIAPLQPRDHKVFDRWAARADTSYTIRSDDGGRTWDKPLPVVLDGRRRHFIRGNMVELDDGGILMPLYTWEGQGNTKSILARSEDQGSTWQHCSDIAKLEGYDLTETSLLRTVSGKIIAFIRAERSGEDKRKPGNAPLIMCRSYDNGLTWSAPEITNLDSPSPYHALRLKSGNVFLTYGKRYEPFEITALLLNEECTDIDEAEQVCIEADMGGWDMGYTNSVQMKNGDILVNYYGYSKDDGKRCIKGCICREE